MPRGFPELAPIETEIVVVIVFGIFSPIVEYWLYQAVERHARMKRKFGGVLAGWVRVARRGEAFASARL